MLHWQNLRKVQAQVLKPFTGSARHETTQQVRAATGCGGQRCCCAGAAAEPPEPPGAEGEGRAQEEDAGVRMRSVGGCKRPTRQGRALLLQRLCAATSPDPT